MRALCDGDIFPLQDAVSRGLLDVDQALHDASGALPNPPQCVFGCVTEPPPVCFPAISYMYTSAPNHLFLPSHAPVLSAIP